MATIAQRYEPAVPIAELVEHPDNPRRGDEATIDESMAAHGFYGAVLVQESTRRIIAGNHRTRVARRRGEVTVPVLFVDVDDDQARRLLLVDNRANDQAVYDPAELARLLEEMSATDGALAGTGFDAGDLEALLAELEEEPAPEVDAPIEVAPAHTAPGDLWQLGRHRLLCGDSRSPEAYLTLLEGVEVNLAFTSPPYAEQRDYDASSGFVPIKPDAYVDWFAPVAANVAEHLAGDGSWFVNIKPSAEGLDTELYVFDLVLAHVREWGWHFATEFCWERVGVPKGVTRRFKNQFEPVYQFTRGAWKMRPDAVRHWSDSVPLAGGPGVGDTGWADAQGNRRPMFGAAKSGTASKRQGRGGLDGDALGHKKPNMLRAAGRQGLPGAGAVPHRRRAPGTGALADFQGHGRDAGEFIVAGMAYPGNRLPTFAGSHEATGHAAAFPVGLPAWFAAAYTDPGDVILDPFTGSGSTLLAAEQTGRVGYGLELSPAYVDMTCLRWQRATGVLPVRAGESVDFTMPEA